MIQPGRYLALCLALLPTATALGLKQELATEATSPEHMRHFSSSVFVSGRPSYRSRTVGAYEAACEGSPPQMRMYNGAPVYKRSAGGYTWSLYRRKNGRWVLDFNDVSEHWSGTVDYAYSASATPFDAEWSRNMAVGYPRLEVVGQPAYWYFGSAGVYRPDPFVVHEGATVYRRSARAFLRLPALDTFSLYRRSNGKWYLDTNTVSNAWAGTINYAHRPSPTPLHVRWSKWDWSGSEMSVELPARLVEAADATDAPLEGAPLEGPLEEPVVPMGLPGELQTVADEDDGDAAEDDFSPGARPEPHTVAEPPTAGAP